MRQPVVVPKRKVKPSAAPVTRVFGRFLRSVGHKGWSGPVADLVGLLPPFAKDHYDFKALPADEEDAVAAVRSARIALRHVGWEVTWPEVGGEVTFSPRTTAFVDPGIEPWRR